MTYSADDVNREELRAHAAFLERGDVGMSVVLGFPDVVAIDGAAGDVIVRVDENGRVVHSLHFRVGHLAGLRERQRHNHGRSAYDWRWMQ